MKLILLLSLCTVTIAFYTDLDDALDMDAVVADPEQIRKYMECYLDQQPCTKSMNGYKKHIKEFVANKCKDCNPIQKHKIEEFVKVLETSYPAYLQQARAKYDSDGKYFNAFDKEMAKF